MTIKEVPRPGASPVAVIRDPEHTVIQVHPGADTPSAIEEIAHRLETDEVEPWLRPWLGTDADLRTLRRIHMNPRLYMPPEILAVPALISSVPLCQRAPWQRTA